MILFYSLEVKFDGFSLQEFMRTFPLLCIYDRSEIKLTCGILFVLGRDKKRDLPNLPPTLCSVFSTQTHACLGVLGQFSTGIGIISVLKSIFVKATSA